METKELGASNALNLKERQKTKYNRVICMTSICKPCTAPPPKMQIFYRKNSISSLF